ncbi:hypothetical protein BgiBS90_003466 [Biomphalaria glabrata]|nr:hypothetical protein BgiBS90_003466 [Biomphalaria glabrata]
MKIDTDLMFPTRKLIIWGNRERDVGMCVFEGGPAVDIVWCVRDVTLSGTIVCNQGRRKTKSFPALTVAKTKSGFGQSENQREFMREVMCVDV